jgi:hypothetical protein
MRLLLLVLFGLGVCAVDAQAGGLAKMDRTITKEPAYKAKPQYCLVALGPDPKDRVWLMLDGETFYVDAKGSGDITQAVRVKPQPVMLTGLPEPGQKPARALRFPCAVTKGFTVDLMTINGDVVQVDVKDGKRKLALAAYADGGGHLKFSDRPATAPVIHAAGRLVMVLPAGRVLERGGKGGNLMVNVGIPGLGAGTFASLNCDSVPKDLHPVAEIAFPPKDGGKAIRQRFTLDQRC